ncbi:MAG: hypothetical protein KDD51_02405 [Bdellovibrionales bacterium]|nr:hypothetical protein [Bdellovibrionales bacterium]
MLDKYLRRFRAGRPESNEVSEEHFRRLFALSSELLCSGRNVAIMGCGLVSMGHVLGIMGHHTSALEFSEGEQSLLPTAGIVDAVFQVHGYRIDLQSESLDVVVGLYTFLRDLSRPLLLREVARVLRPGSQLMLVEPSSTKKRRQQSLQSRHGLPVVSVDALTEHALGYYSKDLFDWKMPYHFPFEGGWTVYLGDRRWELVTEAL